MPKRLHNALNPKTVATLSKPGLYADGNGLALKVDANGNRRWIQRLSIEGKMTMRGLGPYPAISLADARKAAASNLLEVQAGTAKAQREPAAPSRPPVPTFAEAAERIIESRRPTWSNPKHAEQWASTLERYAFPVIGDKRVDEVTTADVLAILEPIWTEKAETASRVRQRMETVFDWSQARSYRSGENPAGKYVLRVLPNVKRLKAHHPALPYQDVPAALRKARQCTAKLLTKFAFELLVLTASRSGEIRLAEWNEIDWGNSTWTVPAEKMKARKEHRVPLSQQAMTVLRDAWEWSGDGEVVFPGPRSGGPLTDMALTSLLRRLKIPAVPHGFRSSFRDWAAERSGAPWAVCESALAHTVGNSTEQAYFRSDLFEQRRGLMQQWAEFCCG